MPGRAPWSGSPSSPRPRQALLVLPAIGLTYLVMAPIPLRRRLLHGAGAAAAAVVAAGWWVVLAVTSDAAPYAGQTTTGSFIDYILGINGLDRLGGGAGPGNDPFGGSGGWGRLFNSEVGGQVSWLIPLAIMALVVAVVHRPADRTERTGWLLWGSVFATHFVVFSLMAGVFHPYYSMTIAPAIAVLAGAGVAGAWRSWREAGRGWWLLPVGVAATAGERRAPRAHPWLRRLAGTGDRYHGSRGHRRHGLAQIPTRPSRGSGDAGSGTRRLHLLSPDPAPMR